MKKRKYTLKQRADQQTETRDKIVQATMALHGELGPRNTNISAIAERAGVQRLTVYRHFANEEELFLACTSLWLEQNPPPDPTQWQAIEDPQEKISTALSALYHYYGKTFAMWQVSYRDVDEVAALQQPMAEVASYLTAVSESLLPTGLNTGLRKKVLATLQHLVSFSTWQSLEDQHLNNKTKLVLVMLWLKGCFYDDGSRKSAKHQVDK